MITHKQKVRESAQKRAILRRVAAIKKRRNQCPRQSLMTHSDFRGVGLGEQPKRTHFLLIHHNPRSLTAITISEDRFCELSAPESSLIIETGRRTHFYNYLTDLKASKGHKPIKQ